MQHRRCGSVRMMRGIALYVKDEFRAITNCERSRDRPVMNVPGAAFRIQKDQLNIRPIWHQREDRVQAHILVCFLAFVLWKCLEMWQSRARIGNSPRAILEELARIQ